MSSGIRFCRECGKARKDNEDRCSTCGWSFIAKEKPTVKTEQKSKSLSSLRNSATSKPKRETVPKKYETLRTLIGIIVVLHGFTLLGTGSLFIHALQGKTGLVLPSLGALMAAFMLFILAVAAREFVLVFLDIETGVRKVLVELKNQSESP